MSQVTAAVHIVDDDTSFLTATARLPRASGFEVKTFASAKDLLVQPAGATPGCVADLHMPGWTHGEAPPHRDHDEARRALGG